MAVKLKIETELDNRVFVHGEEVNGRVEWDSGSPEADSGEVRLFYYTAGKGTRDVEIVEQLSFDRPGASGSYDFRFKIPEGTPPSYSGRLTSLMWAVEFEIIGAGGDSEILEMVVSPTGEEIKLYSRSEGVVEKSFGIQRNG